MRLQIDQIYSRVPNSETKKEDNIGVRKYRGTKSEEMGGENIEYNITGWLAVQVP